MSASTEEAVAGKEETVTVNTFLVVNQRAAVSLSSSKPAGEEFFTTGRPHRVACNMAGYRLDTSTARYCITPKAGRLDLNMLCCVPTFHTGSTFGPASPSQSAWIRRRRRRC